MKLAIAKTVTAAAALLLALTACSEDAGSNGGTGDGGEDPVFAAMKTWDACEVLDNLQPITDYMGIEGYGSLTSAGGDPVTREYDTTWYPDAIGCGNLIYLGSQDGIGVNGEIKVNILPAEDENQASAFYAERTSLGKDRLSDDDTSLLAESAIGDPWDEGVEYVGRDYGLMDEAGDDPTGQHQLEIVARDGQWVFQISLYYSEDWGESTGVPMFKFDVDELNQWFIETYLPAVNQAVNDKIAEVQ